MLKIDSVNYSNKQYSIINNNDYFVHLNDNQADTVSFKAKLKTIKPKTSILKRIGMFLGITSATTIATVATVKTQNAQVSNENELVWNPECKGYKRLTSEGFSNDMIDKTLAKLEPRKAELLKTGMSTWILKDGIRDLYDLINKEVKDDEKSAEITFNLFSDIFDKAIESNVSKDDYIYTRALEAAFRIYGLEALNKGKLENKGDFFLFEDENGKNITDREKEIIDSEGNKLVVNIDSYGDPIMDRGKKYSPDDRLLEEWSSGSRTIYEYDANNQLIGKQKEYGNGFHRYLDKYKYIDGSWIKVK